MKKWTTIAAMVFLFASCNKGKTACPGAADKSFSLSGFNKVTAGETFTVTVSRGSGFGVYATGCANDLADLDLSVDNGQTLNINYVNFKPNRYRVDFTITVPRLTAVNLSGKARGNISGFKDQLSVIRSVVSANAVCTLNGAPVSTQVELSGNADLAITGSTENLYGNISGYAALHAYPLAADEVDIDVSGNSKVYVSPQKKIYGTVSGNGYIYYKGNPAGKYFETNGNGKIIHE